MKMIGHKVWENDDDPKYPEYKMSIKRREEKEWNQEVDEELCLPTDY